MKIIAPHLATTSNTKSKRREASEGIDRPSLMRQVKEEANPMITKKQYRQEIKLMKDIIKGIAVVAEQETEYTDRMRTIEACAALQQRAENLSNLMKMIIVEEQRRVG